MAKRKRRTTQRTVTTRTTTFGRRYGAIQRTRAKVRAAATRYAVRHGASFPEDAARKFPMRGEVYRRRDGLYQGWVCFTSGRPYGKKRAGQRCGEAKGRTPTEALAKAAFDFGRTLKGRG